MEKPDVSGILEKVKSGAGDLAEKARIRTAEAAGSVKETADEIIKTAREKGSKKTDAREDLQNAEEAGKAVKGKKQRKEDEPEIRLNDVLRTAIDRYNDAYTMMNDNGVTLYRERIRAVDLILHIEDLVNSIANHPKEFDTEIQEIKTQRQSFTEVCDYAREELETARKSALAAGAGAATGAAVVSVAPTVAMWVATTFGTASTGTAISSLSGAAAANAALAWLGGGALTAGGGGMAAGNALLALAGPIGWGIAGVTLLSSVVLFKMSRFRMDKKKRDEIESIKNNTFTVQKLAAQIQMLLDEVAALRKRLDKQYSDCLMVYGRDFLSISREQQIQLGVLVNNTKSLAATLGKSI